MAARWPLVPADPKLTERYERAGLWGPETLGSLADRVADPALGGELTIRSSVRPWTGSYRELHDAAYRVAASWRRDGVAAGDVVAIQVPNSFEAVVSLWAGALLGAVLVPIVHYYRAREVRHILAQTGAGTFVVAARIGDEDRAADALDARDALPGLRRIVVVGPGTAPEGTTPFEDLLGTAKIDGPAAVAPHELALIAYTSGSSADPKGVMHTHRGLVAEMDHVGEILDETYKSGIGLVATPLGHMNGLLNLLFAAIRGQSVVLLDGWSPAVAAEEMRERGALWGGGPTFFLTSLLDSPGCDDDLIAHLARSAISLGGSSVPPAVCDRAASLGLTVVRSYGLTEHPTVSSALPGDPRDKRHLTDGRACTGVEIRITDDADNPVPVGTLGEIQSRGPDLFVGYVDPRLNDEGLTADGWLRTGDLGVLDEDGFVTVVDRRKDIVIRGGENISASEVENHLTQLGGILEAAVVAGPDPVYGERVIALVRTGDQAVVTLDAVREELRRAGLARQKWPAELRVVEDFPRTPSGKIKKSELRRQLVETAP